MSRYAEVRPHRGSMRERVAAFLAEIGYERGTDMCIEPGTSDEVAADWASRTQADLLVLPFHVHRDEAGRVVDGVGVASRLGEPLLSRGVPIVMPVSDFSREASFARRFEELRAGRPDVWERVVVLGESDVGSQDIARAIRRRAREVTLRFKTGAQS